MLRIPLLSHEAPLSFVVLALLLLFIWQPLKPLRRSLINTSVFYAACLCGDLLAGILLADHNMTAAASWLRQMTVFGEGLAVIRFAGLALFNVALPRIHIHIAGILADILVIIGYIGWGFFRLNQAGVELTHLFATSAILTAVAGDIDAGYAGQPCSAVWRCRWTTRWKSATGSRSTIFPGQVTDIQWRYTAAAHPQRRKSHRPEQPVDEGALLP